MSDAAQLYPMVWADDNRRNVGLESQADDTREAGMRLGVRDFRPRPVLATPTVAKPDPKATNSSATNGAESDEQNNSQVGENPALVVKELEPSPSDDGTPPMTIGSGAQLVVTTSLL